MSVLKPHWHSRFSHWARWSARVAGHPAAFLLAVVVVLVWTLTGPVFGFSDTWQLVINTSTTIVTFLMVFLLQNSQNRDTIAMQVKLDELVRAVQSAKNSVIDLEELGEEELEKLLRQYQKLGNEARAQTAGAAPDQAGMEPVSPSGGGETNG